MGIEKEISKNGGGYVGGFFQLFDWTAKSRKKLFSSKSDLPERSKQGKRSDGSFPTTRLHLMDEDEIGAGSSVRGGSDYSCASSVTDDDGYGARAPGVVARLMGLDSMPTSSFSEPNSTPFFDTQSLREASCGRRNFDYYHDHQIVYSGNLLSKDDVPPRNFVESKPQKVLGRPIEKFQTEILPPKSAKSIPITHHKLLSPIKSPGFIPSKTAAHIMEAAAKIIEPSPQLVSKTKMPVVGSSSVPLRVRDLKEKMEVTQKMPLVGSSSVHMKAREPREKAEASHKASRLAEASRRPVESNAAKYLKGQSLNKSWNGSEDSTSYRAFPEKDEGSSSSKTKGKSISLAIQAKVNVQRREGLNSNSSRSSVGQKEQSEAVSCQTFKSQPNVQKSVQKRYPIHNATGALRQNNQKQNCVLDKDKLPSKPLVANLQGRKVLSGNPPVRHKTSGRNFGSKTGLRKKLNVEATESEKGNSTYSMTNVPRKKRSIDGNLHLEKIQAADNMLIDNNQKTVESSPNLDRHFSWAEESKRKGMDVVSFTFTAPMTRPMPGSETSGQAGQRNSSSCLENRGKRLLLDTDTMKLSSVGYNVIGGDALSALLEQKLRELTKSVESSSSVSSLGSVSTVTRLQDSKNQSFSCLEKSGRNYDSDLFSTTPATLRLKHMFQGADEMDCSSKSSSSRQLLDCRGPSPVSVLEHCFSTESSSSSDSMDSCSTAGSKRYSSIQAQEVLGLSSSKKFHLLDADMELSDSASSTSTGTVARRHANSSTVTGLMRSTNWEIEYVKKILCNLELMFQDFRLGRCSEIINPHLFHQLEKQKDMLDSECVEGRLERKLLFDCASECLDLRFRGYVGGGYKAWVKGVTMVRRKEWLAEEVHKEISSCSGMGDCMVDELVDKDMSGQYGRWLDFEVDTFTLGVELEGQIFNSLVNEVVADILRF